MPGVVVKHLWLGLAVVLLPACPPTEAFGRNEQGCYDSWRSGVPEKVSSWCRFDVSCGGKESYDACVTDAGPSGAFEATCFDGCLLAGCVDAWTDAAALCETENVDELHPDVQAILATCDEHFVGPPCLGG